jgi:hypothetical protein
MLERIPVSPLDVSDQTVGCTSNTKKVKNSPYQHEYEEHTRLGSQALVQPQIATLLTYIFGP